jgi:pyridoxine 4-dehydrogenase
MTSAPVHAAGTFAIGGDTVVHRLGYGGMRILGPWAWGEPEYLRQCVHMSLRRLGKESFELYQLHRVDEQVPLEDQVGALAELREAGLIRHVGLSEVDLPTIEKAAAIVPIATVQNLYNLGNRQHEDVLRYCEANDVGFIPWFPMAMGRLAGEESPLTQIAAETGATPAQLALAWLLARSPVVLPIPGTGKVAHVEENCAAAGIALTAEQVDRLSAAVPDVHTPSR